MKITQVTPYFTPHIGGVESHVLALARWLIHEGHEVTVVSSKIGPEPEEECIDDIRVLRLKPMAVFFNTPINYLIRRTVVNLDTQLIHAHVPPPITEFFAVRAARQMNVPFVLTYHCDLEIPTPAGKFITELYRRSLGLYAIRHATSIIATTSTYHATSRSVWEFEPVVIPNAINADLFNPETDGSEIKKRHGIEDYKVVLYVGRLRFHKGLEYLTESAKYMAEDTKYLIVGGGNFRPRLEELIDHYGVRDRIIVAGKVPNEDLPKYYAAADVFVLPSVSRLEAFGIVGLEAMATGKPTVVSDIPGVSEVITDGREGLLAEPMNPRSIAEKLTILLEDQALREQMGRNGRQTVIEKYHWGEVVKKFVELYEELLE